MGRLQVVAIALTLVACDKSAEKPTVTRERSQAVAAKGPADTATAAPAPAPSAAPAPVKARKICDGELEKPPRDFPTALLSRAAAPGAAGVSAQIPVGHGKWTWVNLWAAWCVPCKHEIPTLLAWQKQLAGKLAFAFVSLDDDQRQLEGFLGAQAAGGLKATWWLEDGKQRETWLGAAAVEEDPDLPVQLLVDPNGKIRCTIHGAIEDGDLAELRRIVGG